MVKQGFPQVSALPGMMKWDRESKYGICIAGALKYGYKIEKIGNV